MLGPRSHFAARPLMTLTPPGPSSSLKTGSLLALAAAWLFCSGCAGVIVSERLDPLAPIPEAASEHCFIESLPGPVQEPLLALWGDATAPVGPVRPPHSRFHPVPTAPVFAARPAALVQPPLPLPQPSIEEVPGQPTPAEPLPLPAEGDEEAIPLEIPDGNDEGAPREPLDIDPAPPGAGDLEQEGDRITLAPELHRAGSPDRHRRLDPWDERPRRPAKRLDTMSSGRGATLGDGWRRRL